jgi:hypothetical protein
MSQHVVGFDFGTATSRRDQTGPSVPLPVLPAGLLTSRPPL